MEMNQHLSVPRLNGQDMCNNLLGELYCVFNLISDTTININSTRREKNLCKFATFLGNIRVLVQPEEWKDACLVTQSLICSLLLAQL